MIRRYSRAWLNFSPVWAFIILSIIMNMPPMFRATYPITIPEYHLPIQQVVTLSKPTIADMIVTQKLSDEITTYNLGR